MYKWTELAISSGAGYPRKMNDHESITKKKNEGITVKTRRIVAMSN